MTQDSKDRLVPPSTAKVQLKSATEKLGAKMKNVFIVFIILNFCAYINPIDSCPVIKICNDFRVETLEKAPTNLNLPNETIIGKTGHWGGIKPESYHIALNFLNRTHHNGSIDIKFKIVEPTDKIFVNQDAEHLAIDYSKITLRSPCDGNESSTEKCIEKVIYVAEERTLILFLKNFNLRINENYTLTFPSFHPTEKRYSEMKTAFGLRDWISEDGSSASLTTVFQMRYARTAFPCLDNIALKAHFHLCVEHPDYLLAASNSIRDETRSTSINPNRKRDCFYPTPLLPTYIFTISLMENYTSEKIQMPNSNFTIEVFAPKADIDQYRQILNLSIKPIQYMTNVTNFEFPLKRFGFLITNPKDFGGLEHMGLISLDRMDMREPVKLEIILFHEIVHQWIGNTVTVGDWRQICLQEGLTTYFEWKIWSDVNGIPLEERANFEFVQDDWAEPYNAFILRDHDDFATDCFKRVPRFFHTITKITGSFDVMEKFLARLILKKPYGTADIDIWDETMGEVTNGSLRGYLKSKF